MKTLNERDRKLLKAIVADVRHHAAQPIPSNRYSRAYEQAMDAREGMVRIDLAHWLGSSPTPSESTLAGRSYKALEGAGLIERLTSRFCIRPTRVFVTDAGFAFADKLMQEGGTDAQEQG